MNPYGDIIELPEACEIAVREKDGAKYIFVLNYSKENAEIVLKKECKNMYDGNVESGSVMLEGYGTRVYKL